MYCIDTEALHSFSQSTNILCVLLVNKEKLVHHCFLAPWPYLCRTSVNDDCSLSFYRTWGVGTFCSCHIGWTSWSLWRCSWAWKLPAACYSPIRVSHCLKTRFKNLSEFMVCRLPSGPHPQLEFHRRVCVSCILSKSMHVSCFFRIGTELTVNLTSTPGPKRGRYLAIQLATRSQLSICEVQIMGTFDLTGWYFSYANGYTET